MKVTFISADGKARETVDAREGWTILDIAHKHDIDIEGVCGGGMACSTCHVFVAEKFLEFIPDATEEEAAILAFAPGIKPNSRLGCQIKLTKALDGIEVQLPEETESQFL